MKPEILIRDEPAPALGVPDTRPGMTRRDPIDGLSGRAFEPRCAHATDLGSVRAPRPVPQHDGDVVFHLHDPETNMYRKA